MNEITERFDPPVILEDYREASGTAKGPHLARIAGTYNREGARSKNRRTYTGIDRWINEAQARIEQGETLSMYTSHDSAASDATLQKFGKLTRVHVDGGEGKFEGYIANTSVGRDVLTLIEGGYATAISQRLAGPIEHETLKAEASPDGKDGWEVITYGVLKGIDITDTPGIESASMHLAESEDAESLVESFSLHSESPYWYWERDFTAAARKTAAGSGAAMPDGSFPIETKGDLKNAIKAFGRAKDPEAAKAHIRKRAAALGATDLLPDDWKETTSSSELVAESPPATSQGVRTMTEETESTPDINDARAALTEAMNAHLEGASVAESAAAEKFQATEERAAALEAKLTELTARLDANSTPPTPAASEDTEDAAAVEDDPEVTEAVEQIETATAILTEAGRSVSGGNMSKLQAAHDALNDVAKSNGGSMLCNDADQDGESTDEDTVTESTVQAMVTQAVQAAVTEFAKTADEKIATLTSEYEARIDEYKKARRKSHAVAEAQSDDPSIEDRLAKMTPDERLRFAINHDLGIPTA